MANLKITELTALTTLATGDLFPVVDISDTTDSANGTTKKIAHSSIKAAGTDVDTGTDDIKFVTSKALADAGVYQAGGTDVAIADGGTGASTQTAAFDALAPTTTQGDIIYFDGSDNVRLAKGAYGQYLGMNSGATAPAWATPLYKVGADTRDLSTASGNQTIAHGLGRTPYKVRLTGVSNPPNGTSWAMAVYNGTTQASNYSSAADGGAEEAGATFRLGEADSGAYNEATITVDSTNITIAWTKTGSPTGTANLVWEVE